MVKNKKNSGPARTAEERLVRLLNKDSPAEINILSNGESYRIDPDAEVRIFPDGLEAKTSESGYDGWTYYIELYVKNRKTVFKFYDRSRNKN